ncbi:retrovirus-related Pol polyprotein from transposon TNT 1-94 [Trichonephila clavipes]|nr:retrovirus-related Pol polyprotein from transposon TNT 1-94 [Trichonephila clavipes]
MAQEEYVNSSAAYLGFKASEADPCLYIRERKGRKLLIVLYVDDGLIAATDQQDSEMFIKELKTKFKISVGKVSCFLGLEIEHHKDNSITINQKGYARKILKCFGFKECKPVATPMLKDCRLQKSETKNSDFPYRSLENPSAEDIVKGKRVFRYIAGTVGYGITYHATETKCVLHCYSDSDFSGCVKTSRSTSGYVMIYAGGAISWHSQRQAIVATSTTEAEVIAASEAAKEKHSNYTSEKFWGRIALAFLNNWEREISSLENKVIPDKEILRPVVDSLRHLVRLVALLDEKGGRGSVVVKVLDRDWLVTSSSSLSIKTYRVG